MNLFELANILPRKGQIISRSERIKREGSPNYTYIVPVTATTIKVDIHIPTQFPESRKYEPLDSLEIVNNETVNAILITINGKDGYYCPAGTIRNISGQGVALWQIGITNLGAVNTTLGLIRLTLKKEAMTIDKWATRQ